MRRQSWSWVVLVASLGACDRGAAGPQTTPVATSSAASSMASAPSSSDVPIADAGAPIASPYAPPGTPIPAELRGTVVYAADSGGQDQTLAVITIGTAGAAPPRVIARKAESPTVAGVLSRDARSVVYARLSDTATQTLWRVNLDGSDDRKLAACDRRCELVGFDAKGVLWYLVRSAGDFPTVMRLLPNAARPVAWTTGWSACNASNVVLSPDGQKVLLTIDDSFGWPECIKSAFQGMYVFSTEQGPPLFRRPMLPFSRLKSSRGMNLNFTEASFSADGTRLVFRVNSGGDDELDAGPPATEEQPRWTCRPDGTDARREPAPLRWSLAIVKGDDGDRLVAQPPDAREPSSAPKPISLVGPMKSIDWFAVAPAGATP